LTRYFEIVSRYLSLPNTDRLDNLKNQFFPITIVNCNVFASMIRKTHNDYYLSQGTIQVFN